ncbi:hypothetical protein OHT93_37165 [Streptomyces sp. NBC_00191]|uniref:hypothetical protein n=1 Tax=Streptomyces sp. NBC_00191 TaxID=2975674 RepID=UPI003244B159
MSTDPTKLAAVLICLLLSAVVGFLSGLTLKALGAPTLISVSAGGGAFIATAALGIAIIGLFC